ncbi:ATP-dependent RNA helicase DBP6 [Coccidioides immitis RMSCC 3703]|uniref:ATP-dependent RNA helicase n=1 Tax=Coccidioides immitis RMSCC 3703 TaxID=454286 RepID=A0A0J8RB28_COCIT|nr:ATP-dependent RNA helicase DBP6 [Coccidioides immitis RMSCC 3703]
MAFYARYIPPTSLSSIKSEDLLKSPKHKEDSRHADAAPPAIRSPQKKSRSPNNSSRPEPSINPESHSNTSSVEIKKKSRDANGTGGLRRARSPMETSPTSEASRADSPGQSEHRARGSREADEEPSPALSSPATSPGHTQTKSKQPKRKRMADNDLSVVEAAPPAKHAKILSKYERYTVQAPKASAAEEPGPDQEPVDQLAEEISTHGLTPLPQPEQAPEHSQQPSYATLPEWLAHPVVVSPDTHLPFTELGLHPKQISTLQAKVITRFNHRATRELVKQARNTCELCAAGTGLRIGTAVGSTALKDEQSALMGPRAAWKGKFSSVMTGSDWTNFDLQEYVAEAKECRGALPNHFAKTSPNIDILVSTPGRLVDHIRSTKGFTLKHLKWLVIDEADKLLNESFQEWSQTVLQAVESKGNDDAHPVPKDLCSLPKEQTIRKIILSATMTRDITKLNSLRLINPKLVEVRALDNSKGMLPSLLTRPPNTRFEGYQLPPTLNEMFVPAGDGSDKPLYLLELMASHLNIEAQGPIPDLPRLDRSSATSPSGSEEPSDDDSYPAPSTVSNSGSPDSLPDIPASSRSALIFTKSSESALRLARLLALLSPSFADCIGVLVKSNKSSTARKTLAAYRQGKIPVVVATDRASRGLDLPALDHVISYDVPTSVTSYIHRVGRTARAGRRGVAWTLVAHNEGRWFSNEIVKGALDRGCRSVKRMTIKPSTDSDLRERYASALKQLEKEVVKRHKKHLAVDV